MGETSGPGIEAANAPFDFQRGSLPVDEPVFFLKHRCEGRRAFVLFGCAERAFFELAQSFQQQPRTDRVSASLAASRGFSRRRASSLPAGRIAPASIFSTSFMVVTPACAFAVDDRPGGRRRAAVLRQERVMHVETSLGREFENRFRQNAPVGNHDDDVGLPVPQRLREIPGCESFRRRGRNIPRTRANLSHRRGRSLLAPAAPGGPAG